MRTPPKNRGQVRQRRLNALVYCLVVVAVFLIVIAAQKRYSQRRRPGERPPELGDAVDRRIDAFMPDIGFAENWIKTGGPPQDTFSRCLFVCPQCQSSCWTYQRRGNPTCPFCGRVMARLGRRMSPVGGTWGAAPPVPILVGALPRHGNRGACANCHAVAGSGSLRPALNPVGAAPAVAPRAVRPTLVREFGMEVCPAQGAGAKVTGVMGSSYASRAGFRAGDIIIGFNGSNVRSARQFQRLASRATPETDAQIKIVRNGRTRDLLVMVGEGEMEGFTSIRRP